MEKDLRMKKLLKVIDHEYNDYIGGNENAYLDGGEYYAWTIDKLIETIVNYILTSDGYLPMENTWEVVEAKHLRFLGKKELIAVVSERCYARKKKDGKWLWEK